MLDTLTIDTLTVDTLTVDAPAKLVAPALPELDPALGHQLGDDILLGAVRDTKIAKVPAGQARSESRAWGFGGGVD